MSLLRSDFVYRGSPMIVKGAAGSRLHTSDGQSYVDLEAASGAAILGYDADLLASACARAMPLPNKPQFCESTTRLELTRRLDDLFLTATGVPGRLAFDLGGSQGIELALKIVSSKKPEATTIVTFDGCYHGRSLEVGKISASARYDQLAGQGAFRVLRLPVPSLLAYTYRINLDDAVALCRKRVDELFTDERFGLIGGRRHLHSLLFEPILNVAGMFPIDATYLGHVVEFVRALGGTIIADEVFTGFFKGIGFLASPGSGINPDIIVTSKGLTNGLAPLSAIWVREGIDEAIGEPGLHSSTYINNELAICAALSVLERIEEHPPSLDTPHHAIQHLFEPYGSHPAVREVFISHNVGAIRLQSVALARCLSEALFTHGVLAATTGLARDAVIVHPSLTITDAEVELAATGVERAFAVINAEPMVA